MACFTSSMSSLGGQHRAVGKKTLLVRSLFTNCDEKCTVGEDSMAKSTFQAAGTAILMLVSACSAYRPLAVTSQDGVAEPQAPRPRVLSPPVYSDTTMSVWRDSEDALLFYVTPTQAEIVRASAGALLAVAVERSDGRRLFVLFSLSPPEDLLASAALSLERMGLADARLMFYPMQHLGLRPLTDPMEPHAVNYSGISSPGALLRPPATLILLQVLGRANVASMKALLKQAPALLFEASYPISIEQDSAQLEKTLSLQLVVEKAVVSSLSM